MKKRFTLYVTLLFCMKTFAQDGTLDTSFGTGGRAFATPPGLNQSLSKTVVQRDGKVIMAGRATNCCGYDFSVTRFNNDGSLDNTFGREGIVITEFTPGAWDIITTVAVQPDGKIIAGGYSSNRFALARYHIDGSLDSSFNGNGKLTGRFNTSSEIYAVCVLSDGKILAGGASDMSGSSYDFTLARYLSDGSPDLTFDADGIVTTSLSTGSDIIYSLAIQADGKIVAAGTSGNGAGNDFAIVRYNDNGSADSTFNSNGKCIIDFGGNDNAYSAAIQPDGKIVAAGSSDYTMAVARVLSNGRPDNTFNLSGKVITTMGTSFDQLYSVLVQSNGKIMAGGVSFNGLNKDFAVLRFNADGSFDQGFGTEGKLRLDMGADEAYPTMAGWGDKVLIGGYSSNRLAVARLNNSSGIYVLALKVLAFTAAASNQVIHLAWRITSQAPVSFYEIEHSTDGRNFSAAAKIYASGNSNAEQQYAFDYRQPETGMHYFRLKAADKAGVLTYSNVLAVHTGNNAGGLVILQNPVAQTLQVQIATAGRLVLQISNTAGIIVKRFDIFTTAHTAAAFDVAGLSAGAYYLIVTHHDGIRHKLFIKN